jgi:hypothetical protein
MKKQNLVKRTIRLILITFAAAWMLFEDWIWDSLVAFMQVVGRLKIINRFETFLGKQKLISPAHLIYFPLFHNDTCKGIWDLSHYRR